LEEDVIDLDIKPWKLKDDRLPRKLLLQKIGEKLVWCDYDLNGNLVKLNIYLRISHD